jgi:hypothetical protein
MYSWAFFPAPKEQRKFAYTCDEGDEICKCIGHLRADFGRNGDEFWTTWWEHKHPELKTQEFKDAFDEAINVLRRKDGEINPLHSRSAMRKYCAEFPDARDGDVHIFRMDVFPNEYPKTHSVYSLIMRMMPNAGSYDLYCYCYRNEDLEGGLSDARE